jgi:hypothetical protein
VNKYECIIELHKASVYELEQKDKVTKVNQIFMYINLGNCRDKCLGILPYSSPELSLPNISVAAGLHFRFTSGFFVPFRL